MQVLTYHNDNTREGQNTQETILTPANVTSATFGKVGFYSTDAKVDAEPLYVQGVTIGGVTHNVLYVVT
ncbi:MAG TPA: pyrrolo-quinoline quinone, partial [Acidobacteriaceae bacterium]|nr:pyrrolo-quinoline quinone [Acidobacteriaceae bacterium]